MIAGGNRVRHVIAKPGKLLPQMKGDDPFVLNDKNAWCRHAASGRSSD
jgi:hypothetical protein